MKVADDLILALTLCLIMSMSNSSQLKIFCMIAILVSVTMNIFKKKNTLFRLHLLDSDGMNEVLIMDTRIENRSFLFLLDTGYAGPPVLSRSYLSVIDPNYLPLRSRYRDILQKLEDVTKEDEHRAINAFINESNCFPYTSGCTMKLMGIGSTLEQQADMLMCPMLHIRNVVGGMNAPKKTTSTQADVFVTNSLKHSIHILTCDFLLHHNPCLISTEKQTLTLNMNQLEYLMTYKSFYMYDATFSGGSFVVGFQLEDNETLFCTIDTGAPGPICVGRNALRKIKSCHVKEKKKLTQNGVNGEQICSEIVEVDVHFAGAKYKTPVFVNDAPTEQVDGYVGLAFLRAFDILITNSNIGFKKNRNHIKTLSDFENMAASGGCSSINLECNTD